MRKLFVAFLFVCAVKSVAQEVVVKSFDCLQTDLTARTQERLDANGNPCAVVKVDIPLEDVVFKGWVVETVSTPGEYLIYMPEGTSKITIQHKNLTPFTYEFGKSLEAKQTYRLVLTVNKDGKTKPTYKVVEVSDEIVDIYNKGLLALEKKDNENAKKLFLEAANAGYAPAQHKMGYMSGRGREALGWYQKAAAQGYPNSIHNLGTIYRYGEGIQRDDELAFQYYMEAADMEFPESMLLVGYSYANGEGVPSDQGKALQKQRNPVHLSFPPEELHGTHIS
jgi:hypothetical protein